MKTHLKKEGTFLPFLRHTVAVKHSPLQAMQAAWNDVSEKIPEIDLSMSKARVKKLLKRSGPDKVINTAESAES